MATPSMYRCAPPYELVLASGSPRRQEMLRALGLEFAVEVSHVDESLIPGELAETMVARLAREKAFAVAAKRRSEGKVPIVIGADTTVVIDGEILGKPEDESDARRMLGLLQGRVHQVWGAFSIVKAPEEVLCQHSRLSHVTMRPLDAATIDRYLETGEPFDKAGSYAIQGVGTHLVDSVDGSYSNVVGLDISGLVSALREQGIIE